MRCDAVVQKMEYGEERMERDYRRTVTRQLITGLQYISRKRTQRLIKIKRYYRRGEGRSYYISRSNRSSSRV